MYSYYSFKKLWSKTGACCILTKALNSLLLLIALNSWGQLSLKFSSFYHRRNFILQFSFLHPSLLTISEAKHMPGHTRKAQQYLIWLNWNPIGHLWSVSPSLFVLHLWHDKYSSIYSIGTQWGKHMCLFISFLLLNLNKWCVMFFLEIKLIKCWYKFYYEVNISIFTLHSNIKTN